MSNATLLNPTCPWLIVLGSLLVVGFVFWLWALPFGCGLYLMVCGLYFIVCGPCLIGCGLYLLDCGFCFIIMGYVYCHMLKFII
jgi:hypothetical protein